MSCHGLFSTDRPIDRRLLSIHFASFSSCVLLTPLVVGLSGHVWPVACSPPHPPASSLLGLVGKRAVSQGGNDTLAVILTAQRGHRHGENDDRVQREGRVEVVQLLPSGALLRRISRYCPTVYSVVKGVFLCEYDTWLALPGNALLSRRPGTVLSWGIAHVYGTARPGFNKT